MLDIGWWELIVVGMVALVVVGPGELPALLRTIGRYVGMAKRQADEFRSQFDDAIRESEFNDLRDEVNNIKSGVTSSLDEAQESINKELHDAHDWDKDGPIEPAPEFANDPPTTSFMTADGEVIRKADDGDAELTEAPDAPAAVSSDTESLGVTESDGDTESRGAAHRASTTTVNGAASETADVTDNPPETKATTRPSDTEAVR